MGRADYYEKGGWNVLCKQCGFKFKASMLRQHWQGYYVCQSCYEPRQPQDFVRAKADTGRGTAFAASESVWWLPDFGERKPFGDFGFIVSGK